jgi:hypothetical protein
MQRSALDIVCQAGKIQVSLDLENMANPFDRYYLFIFIGND